MTSLHVRAFALFVAAFSFPLVVLAETVTLNNGDRITGSISDSDGKAITLKTDYAGEVKIQWAAIKELAAPKPVFVTTDDKKTISGTIAPNGKNLTVHESNGTTVDVPYAKISFVRSSEGQDAYEKTLHPSWGQDWKVGATVGLGIARGNSDTTNLNTAATADRKTLHDDLAIYESSIYSTNDQPGGGVTANAILGGARYSHNITDKLFGFVSGDFTHDELQDLDLRAIYSGGLGWHAIDKPNKTTFDILGGINYTRESYSGTAEAPGPSVDRNLPGITFGEIFMHKLGASTTINEDAYFYPDLSDISQYRVSLDANSVTKFKKWLGWQISISDRYVTNPPIANTKSNDVILSTGINVAFGK
jgi:hypothetical protein